MEMLRVLFVVTTGGEAELMHPIYEGLVLKGFYPLCIDTGLLCCDKGGKLPADAMDRLPMPNIPLESYKTKNLVSILKNESPDIVIVGSDQEYLRRAFAYAANGLNIPTLLLDLGISDNITNTVSIAMKRNVYRISNYFVNIIRKYLYLLRVVVELKWNPLRILKMILDDLWVALTIDDDRGHYGCTAIVVSGSWGKKVLIERGVCPDIIHITGNPKMGVVARGHHVDNNIRQTLGIGSEKIILLLTCAQVEHGRWTVNMRTEFFKGLLEAVEPLLSESMKLVIKIHPIEHIEVYQELINGRDNIIVHRDLVLTDIIDESEVVLVGGYSSTVLEASSLGKPVVLLNTFNEIEGIPYEKMGLAIETHKFSDLRFDVESMLYDLPFRETCLKKAKDFFDNNREFVDGKATERITNLIMDMAEAHNTEGIK